MMFSCSCNNGGGGLHVVRDLSVRITLVSRPQTLIFILTAEAADGAGA